MSKTYVEKSGILFPNDKGGVEARPDFRGDILINGVVYRLSGWKKQSIKGPYISLQATEEKELEL